MSERLVILGYLVLLITPVISWMLTKLMDKKDISPYEKAKKTRNIYRTLFVIVCIPMVFMIISFFKIISTTDTEIHGDTANYGPYTLQDKVAFNLRFKKYEGIIPGVYLGDLFYDITKNSEYYYGTPNLVPNIAFFEINNENETGIAFHSIAISEEGGSSVDYFDKVIDMGDLVKREDDYYVTFKCNEDLYDEDIIETIIISHIPNDGEFELEKIEKYVNDYLENDLNIVEGEKYEWKEYR